MQLGQLIEGLNPCDFIDDPRQQIKGLAYDSRRVRPGYMFVALKGHTLDGNDYITDAVQKGAVAVVGENLDNGQWNIQKIGVSDSRSALAKLAAQFYGHPFKSMNLIGITGTNGKTTTSYLLESIFLTAGIQTGIIGTIDYHFPGKTLPAQVTTPESLDLIRLLREMSDSGISDVIMEVSSHALAQKRTGECRFRVAVFTNLSRDHLDYHRTMDEYFRAKSRLFSELKNSGNEFKPVAVINIDDPRGKELADLTGVRLMTYGLSAKSHIRADFISADKSGLRARLITPDGEANIRSPLLGEINIYNIMAASAAAMSMNIDLKTVVKGIERLEGVPGRLDAVKNNKNMAVVVDYAHTPDALLKTLQTLRPLVEGRLITVFGCGGDRDKGKRYEMGFAAGQNSDLVFITSDNPRSEEPISIIRQIEKGVKYSGLNSLNWSSYGQPEGHGYFIEAERGKAIRNAVSIADKRDLVLIAGKGHEDYQIIGNKKKYFDDRKEAAQAVSELNCNPH